MTQTQPWQQARRESAKSQFPEAAEYAHENDALLAATGIGSYQITFASGRSAMFFPVNNEMSLLDWVKGKVEREVGRVGA